MSTYFNNLKTTFKVFKIFAKNIGTFDNLNFKNNKGATGVAKTVLMIFLMLYCFGTFFFMFGSTMSNIYNMYASMGNPERMPLTAIFITVMMTLFFGFVSVASNYYTGHGEEYFCSLPLHPMCIFGGKFGVSFITDSIYGFLMILISGIIYGLKQGTLKNPLIYLGFITSGITVSLITIYLIYLIFIVVLLAFKKLRKKSFLSAIATVFVLVFAMGYGVMSGGMSAMGNGGNTAQLSSYTNVLTKASDKFSFLKLFSNAYNGNIIPILIEIAISAIILFVLVPAISPAYIKTLDGFADVKTKKMKVSEAKEVLNKESKANSILKALYLRDIKTMFRESTFFVNGPLMIFLFPVLIVFSFAVSFFTQTKNLNINFLRTRICEDIEPLLSSPDKLQQTIFYLTLIMSGITTFIANMSNVAPTCFSREGKAVYELKAMPIDYNTLLQAKFLHALTYPILASVINLFFLCLANLFFGNVIEIAQILKICVMTICVTVCISLPLIIFGMLIDTANPKLQWENPMVAFKQNLNSLFALLVDLSAIAIFVALALLVLPKNEKGLIILCWIFIAISAPTGRLYWKYANKKIPLM